MKHWWADSNENSRLEQVDLDKYQALVAEAPPHRRIDEIIVHHTWSPTVAQWRGRQTWQGIDRYHEVSRGWSDIGYHLGVGPDLSIWLLRPLPRAGGHTLNHNAHSVGVSMIGCYDTGRDDPKAIMPYTASLVRALIDRYALSVAEVRFHREFAAKSCPGTGIDLGAFRAYVRSGTVPQAAPTPEPPPVRYFAENGADWREHWVHNGPDDEPQGKVYLRPRP